MHFKEVCKHGRVMRQCKCPDPSKSTTVVACNNRCPVDEETVDLTGIEDIQCTCGTHEDSYGKHYIRCAIMQFCLAVHQEAKKKSSS